MLKVLWPVVIFTVRGFFCFFPLLKVWGLSQPSYHLHNVTQFWELLLVLNAYQGTWLRWQDLVSFKSSLTFPSLSLFTWPVFHRLTQLLLQKCRSAWEITRLLSHMFTYLWTSSTDHSTRISRYTLQKQNLMKV